jgi:phage terminase large subunit GpA-like protein
MSGLPDLHSAYRLGIRPDAILSVSEWADRYRILTSETSAFIGQWETDRLPWLREPMDRLSPSDPCTFVVLKFASQMGKTEIGLNWLGRSIHMSPAPFLVVQPDLEKAREYGKHRFDSMKNACPELKALVAESKSRDGSNTLIFKTFPGGLLRFAGSNSPASVASTPCRYVHIDECDNVSAEAGGQGDTADQAIQRTSSFPNRKILIGGTPTFTGASRVDAAFESGDQNRYWVPCPHCGEYQALKWSGVHWDSGKPETAHYVCEANGCIIENRHKSTMLPLGQWRPDNPDATGQIRSYHINALYMPHGWPNDFAELARLWIAAHKDPVKLKAFINLKLGESWDPFREGGISHDYLHVRSQAAAEEFGHWVDAKGEDHHDPIPDECQVLTCAVDVQADRLEVEVRGWGVGEEVWSVDYVRMPGDLSAPQVWEQLDEYLGREWITDSGWTMGLERVCIDSGGHYTQQVYDFVRDKRSRHIMAIKGQAGPRAVWNPKASQSVKGRCPLYLIGVDGAKEVIYGRLKLDKPGPCFTHFPAGRSEDYFRSLVAERMERHSFAGQPRIRWVCPPKTPNEGLDLAVYNFAAFRAWTAAGNSLDRRAAQRAAGKPVVDDPGGGVQGIVKRAPPRPRRPHWLDGGPAP